MTARTTRLSVLLPAAAAGALAAQAGAQSHFSIDYQGPTIAAPDTAFGAPITEGDVLLPVSIIPVIGPLPPPMIDKAAGPGGPVPLDLGLVGYGACAGHAPGTACTVEVDALSHGLDNPMDPMFAYPPAGMLRWSVDEYAVGFPTGFVGPDLFTEAGVADASADVFTERGLVPGPLPPGALPGANVGVVDGDGLPSGSGFVYPGLGLLEPNPGIAVPGPTPGDNLDAWDEETPPGFYPAFFSLEGALLDPITGGAGSGSAAFHGFSSADVLATFAPGAAPFVYAPAPALGLDIAASATGVPIPSSDDLDALMIWENGSGAYEPVTHPYSWTTGATDMVLFSVRRGSAVIGAPDSNFGIPIEEGDILMPPTAGGLSPFPGIFIAAENLGLVTVRSAGIPGMFADELDALDARFYPQFDCDGDGIEDAAAIGFGSVPDCNGNGVPDSCDIASGTSSDFNGDGIPDECGPGVVTCVGDGSLIPCPCGNESTPGSGEGCLNSTGAGAILYTTGTSVVANNDLVFHVAQARPSMPALLVQGASFTSIPFKDGVLCAGTPTERVEVIFLNAAGAGSTTGSIVTNGNIPIGGGVRHYQMWYRDPTVSPCMTGSNFSQGITITWI